MAKKTKKAKRRGCPPCTEGAIARSEFKAAINRGQCSAADRHLDKIKSDLGRRSDNMSKAARKLAFRELLSKQDKVNRCRDKAEAHDANRFNGVLGLGGLLGIL